MKHRTLGPYTVSAIGLGAMPMSMNNDGTIPTEAQSIATIHAALDSGVTSSTQQTATPRPGTRWATTSGSSAKPFAVGVATATRS